MGIKRIVQGNNSKIVRPIGRLFSTPVLLLLSSTLFTLPVLANDDQNTSSNSPWYVGTAIGSSTSDLTQNEQSEQKSAAGVTVNTVNIDDSRVGWKLNVGFDVTRNLAIEAGYMDINETSVEHDPVVNDPAIFASNDQKTHLGTADGFTLGSVYRFEINDDIGLNGSVVVF
jgi:hypothetical protein